MMIFRSLLVTTVVISLVALISAVTITAAPTDQPTILSTEPPSVAEEVTQPVTAAPTDQPTILSTEPPSVAEEITQPVTAAPTDQPTISNTEPPSVAEDGFYVIIFAIAVVVGIMLAKAFSFWKW